SGIVTDSLGFPIAGVDLDVDSIGGGRVYTPGDNTDSLLGFEGTYRIVTPPGLFRIRFDPPIGSRYRGLQLDSVSISGDTTINAYLSSGQFISGQILDDLGAAAVEVDVDLRLAVTGEKVFLSHNKTNAAGVYQVVAPQGVYTLQLSPPNLSPLVAVEFDSVAISSDTAIDVTLNRGRLVTTVIRDETGRPIAGADLDYTLESTLVRQFTPHDKTDAAGNATTAVLPDTYEIKADPPPGLLLDQLVLRNVVITNDTLIDMILPPLNRVNVSGRVVDRAGLGISGVSVGAITKPAGIPLIVKDDLTDNAGMFRAGIRFGTIDLMFDPPVGSRYVGKRFENVTFLQDTVWGVVTLDTGVVAAIRAVDAGGNAATGHTLAFVDVSAGSEVYVANNVVDVAGSAVITAPAGEYDISVINPTTQPPDSFTVSGVPVLSDTTFTIVLSGAPAGAAEQIVLRQNYPNPFNGSTRIPYLLRSDTEVSLVIYNVLGRQVREFGFGM
ncbi:MAG: hypothetical protein ACE5GA_10350, partial [Candidatus Zixiibacteriota bacterium]